jgi:hypothetical protein
VPVWKVSVYFLSFTLPLHRCKQESSWQRDMERRLAQSEREAADFLASRLAEQVRLDCARGFNNFRVIDSLLLLRCLS